MTAAETPTTAAENSGRSVDSLEAGVQIGDFRIERRIGAGGMGIVYQARQVSLNRPVALKVLGQSLKRPSDLTRFQREAQAAARLSHPGVANIYFIGQDRHICYLVMELVEGVSLRRVLDRLGQSTVASCGLDSAAREELAHDDLATPIRFDQPTEELAPANTPPDSGKDALNPYLTPQAIKLRSDEDHIRRSCELVRDVAAALAHAHDRGVVHRDIKPDNLLLEKRGQIRVIDFGVARFFDDLSVTYTGQLVGTPLYMSPEQVTGRGAIDPRTDIYSLGLVLYELLTLRPPLEATHRENLLRTIVTKPLPPIVWRNGRVPEGLARIVHKATQKDPDQRYATAAELVADLDRFLAGQSVSAPPYHFRLDEREIVAARPTGVVLAAFIAVAISFLLTMASLFIALFAGVMAWQMGGWKFFAVQTAIACVILAVGLAVAWGLLGARRWAWWLDVGLSILLLLACLAGVVLIWITGNFLEAEGGLREVIENDPTATPEERAIGANVILAMTVAYLMPMIVGIALSVASLAALLSRRTREWLAFARKLRREHRQLKESLS
ncbi:MAG TPA: serine/threonine-protein kinase [Pirellulaceae bacterium]|nr:serine/threonine-protein kinase [Pirellulaceae bacterium]